MVGSVGGEISREVRKLWFFPPACGKLKKVHSATAQVQMLPQIFRKSTRYFMQICSCKLLKVECTVAEVIVFRILWYFVEVMCEYDQEFITVNIYSVLKIFRLF